MQGILQGQSNCFNVATLPPQVTNLALSQSPGTITGSFNGVDAAWPGLVTRYRIVYKAGGMPVDVYDGDAINVQPQGLPIYTFTISGLSNGVSYGARVFVRGPEGFQTSEIAQGTITPVAGIDLGSIPEGGMIKLTEDGSGVNFYVSKHNYENNLNGTGRTLVVRKDTYDDRVWDIGNVNAYASSDLDSWFNSTYKNMLDADIRSLIGTTKIRYTPGNDNNTVGTLERAIFALSLTELGQSHPYANTEGSALPIASTLEIAYRNGSATTQWTRSPNTYDTSSAWRLYSNGNISDYLCSYSYGSRPAFTLPANMMFQTEPNSDGSYNPI